ncbi:SDR family oxidoreductase [Bradyrhizobium erythrophlei]|uniref:NAD(P)-dependent dehydrogenase, short-chain alcohol dehydrogenase family n=1 Tax=Bradyrhizobium erythrophlei TaxID=1437360 RepID=A0A1M7UHC4_9BRAD|nr:SDR family oxidoreductase [Bradyrhizobium erythrophlei]SHN82413.1 NAD(P)-dependent dehydrogenase, short-chain alcohol dehydrogenase family [Bradyrhizobium erythrophlei]
MKTLAELADLSGRVALITGGAGHIGRAVANGLAELKCKLCLLDTAHSDVVAVSRKLAARWNTEVVSLEVDLESEDLRATVRPFVEERFSRLDVLINNAAFYSVEKLEGWVAPLEEQSLAVMRRCIEVNLIASFHLAQSLSPLMRNHGGSIINVSSIYGVLGPDMSLYGGTEMGNPAAYGLSKGGLVQMTRWLATMLAPQIRANSISLGGVYRNQAEAFVDRYVARTPMKRMATEEDFIGAVAYLASDLSAYVTGQNLMIDGGWSAW